MSTKALLSTLVMGALFAPCVVRAVEISEIAWMGTSANANAEWIELHNSGSEPVSLSGWRLEGASAPKITLAGSIAAGGYFLLERTSDATVPDISADLIYTGALANTGDTLTLRDAAGNVIDQVVGGANWESVGGDNTTKHTAQKSGNAWVTAMPTPRAAHAAEAGTDADDDGGGDETPSPSVGGTTPSTASLVTSPARTLRLDAGENRIVPTHAPIPFRGIAYMKGNNIRTKAEVSWNFGDGARDTGRQVVHTYEHPGTYAVIVRARDEEADTMRALKVIARDVPIGLRIDGPSVFVRSDDTVLADISGWEVRVGEERYAFPKDTALWPGSEIRFSSSVTGLSTTTGAMLYYPDGTAVTSRTADEL